MNKSSSFGNKLLIKVLGTTVVIFAITMFLVVKFSYETSQKDAQLYIKELAAKSASNIESIVGRSVIATESLAAKYQAAIDNNVKQNPEDTISFMKYLHKNKEIIGIWFAFKQKDLLFEINRNSSTEGYDKEGVFSPYVVKSENGIKISSSEPYNEESTWIKGPKEDKKLHITAPYIYPVNGVDVLMTTIAMPLYKNGTFIGAVGVDISLRNFNTLANNIKVFDHGYAFNIDNYGVILGHPSKEIVGKKLLNVVKHDPEYVQLSQNVISGKDYQFYKKSYKDGLESFYYAKSFEIAQTGIRWSLILSAPTAEYLEHADYMRNFSIIASLLGILIIAIIIYFSLKTLKTNLSQISLGLESFFKYLNKESNSTDDVQIQSNDEFGLMANNLNENIKKIKIKDNEDLALLDDVKAIANEVGEGRLNNRISKSTSTQTLNDLKDILNEMLNHLEKQVGKDMNIVINALGSYSKRDFTVKLDANNTGNIGKEIIEMNKMITNILQLNQGNGEMLQSSSDELSLNTQTLSSNATSQASSLEETAASIDEITSNIEQTNKKAQEMSSISNQTKTSANEGKTLATDTVKAMEDINTEVTAISSAISVIDQIAFQTNILSLNAAVEAATAGEAGKGFAVVAQEVRNLASRSAEAANEIKTLVTNATTKANIGKQISNSMIEGFENLENRIVQTGQLIEDVTVAAQEQTVGMRQISDAVGLLDKFTQENASIADKTNSIAKQTQSISNDIVVNVSKNKFDRIKKMN